jgi:hypothetical protein
MKSLSIARSMVPSQESTRQSFPAPRQFRPDDWSFKLASDFAPDYREGNAIQSDNNYFAKNEGYQNVKNGMYSTLTGQEQIYGHVNYALNHMFGYQAQKQTRVADNMSPAGVMRAPTYKYPVNGPPNVWANVYTGSVRR